jgi:hypothetical protein
MARVIRLEFRGAHKCFNQLRSNNNRGLIAAYRFGEIMMVLNRQGFTLDELGAEFDRKARTISMYIKLFKMYEDEQALLSTADKMKTWSVSRLTGNTAIEIMVFLYHCGNCGAEGNDIVKTKRRKAEVEAEKELADAAVGAPTVEFKAPEYKQAN